MPLLGRSGQEFKAALLSRLTARTYLTSPPP